MCASLSTWWLERASSCSLEPRIRGIRRCLRVGAVDPPRHGATVLRLPSAPLCTPWNDVVRPPKDTPRPTLHRPRRYRNLMEWARESSSAWSRDFRRERREGGSSFTFYRLFSSFDLFQRIENIFQATKRVRRSSSADN